MTIKKSIEKTGLPSSRKDSVRSAVKRILDRSKGQGRVPQEDLLDILAVVAMAYGRGKK